MLTCFDRLHIVHHNLSHYFAQKDHSVLLFVLHDTAQQGTGTGPQGSDGHASCAYLMPMDNQSAILTVHIITIICLTLGFSTGGQTIH